MTFPERGLLIKLWFALLLSLLEPLLLANVLTNPMLIEADGPQTVPAIPERSRSKQYAPSRDDEWL